MVRKQSRPAEACIATTKSETRCAARHQILRTKFQPRHAPKGMAISQSVETGATRSILIGELLDQAALAGVLDSLYELHFTLIAVERLAADEEPWPPPTQGK